MDLFGTETTTKTPAASPALGLFGQSVANLQSMANPYSMSQPQWDALGNLLGAANARPPDPVTGNPGWQAYLTNSQNLRGYQSAFQPPQVGAPSVGSAGIGFSPSTNSYGEVGVPGQAPVTTAQIDPTAAYNAAAVQLGKLGVPKVQAEMQAAGMGRSGAVGEGIANAAAGLVLPINAQVLQSQAQANQLDAQIKARQQETNMLATVQARLQAQQLTAKSQSEYNQIGAQIAEVQAQLQQSAMNLQGTLTLQGQIANQNAAGQRYGVDVSAGTAQGNQLAQLAAQFPQLFNQQYLSGIYGAQAGMNAANFPQSLDILNQKNQQDFVTRLLSGMPQASTTTSVNNPGILGLLGAGTQALNLLGGASGGIGALTSIGSGLSSLFGSSTLPANITSPNVGILPSDTLAGFNTSAISGIDPAALDWSF